MEKRIKSVSAVFCLLAGLGISACSDPIPCPDCDDSAAEMEDGPMPDLPCGGADLMTDPVNCGSCGNNCLSFAGTEWEVGGCENGECVGPIWSNCSPEGSGQTCGSICTASSATCVPGGCSGNTALLMTVGGDFDTSCIAPDPYTTLQGSCDELIPFQSDGTTYVMCCCG